jgi:phosphoserine phosphatase RsbU/P
MLTQKFSLMTSPQPTDSKFRKLRLGTTLVVPFVLQIVAAVSLVAYISFRSGQKAVNDLATQLRVELTSRIDGELRKYLIGTHNFNQLNGTTFSEGNFDMAKASNAKQFLTQVQISPFVYSSYCGDFQGQYLGAYRLFHQGSRTIAMSVSNKDTNYNFYFYAMDSRGRRQQVLEKLRPYDPRKRPWYMAAIEAKKQIWSDVYIDFASGLSTITASEPAYDSSGKVLGVCATDVVLLEDLRKFLASLSIGKTGNAFIIDRKGAMLSSSTKEPLTVGQGENTKLVLATQSEELRVRETAKYLQQQFGSFDRIERSQQLDYHLKGEQQFVQVLPLNDGKGIDWLIVVVLPESDFMGQINVNTRNTIFLTLAALVIAIAISILTSRLITQPILRLTQASKELAAGNLERRVDTADIVEIVEIETLEQSFNSMAGQLQEAFETLEDKVKERTADLAKANDEIIALNERLKEDNLRMGAELDVARQIQMMILPRPEELENIAGLDIAGYMEPADEVGGDYYDVLHTDGVVTLGIGDVTGHGLESGILMLMTQTAVRTLQEIREVDPVIFLDTLNRTIYKNVQRMNSQKSLTLAIVNYADGKISISGQHEETILVRKGGQVERIDTMSLGFPIGLDSDISEFISHAIFELEPGDGIVLYTDGIPEAKDINKVQYQVEKLCEVVSESWNKSAAEIKDAIIADVRRHIGTQKVFDDITLLVLKRQEETAEEVEQQLTETVKV